MTLLARQFAWCVAWVVLFGLLACEHGSPEPPRPAPVPRQATWVGGPDGGVFVLLAKRQDLPPIYEARIYHEGTGRLLFNGQLRPSAEDEARIKPDDPGEYEGWDGEALLFKNGSKLRAVIPTP